MKTYFGLRTIARGKYGDAPYERILLNGKPIYLRAALDQSFNPKGIYTAPDDDFLKRDLIIAKIMGLNGLRIHIKPDEPRRLYWADKLGLLILEDMPNTWRQNAEARDGVGSDDARGRRPRPATTPRSSPGSPSTRPGASARPPTYKTDKDTQDWVSGWSPTIRKLDPTRLVEDNSPCNYDHVEDTDLNSWHFYIDDHDGAKRHIDDVVAQTEAGQRVQLLPRPEASDRPADQLRIRRRLGRRRRPRHLLVLPRPDDPAAPAAQDPGIRLHRADRHRVGA